MLSLGLHLLHVSHPSDITIADQCFLLDRLVDHWSGRINYPGVLNIFVLGLLALPLLVQANHLFPFLLLLVDTLVSFVDVLHSLNRVHYFVSLDPNKLI